MVTIQIPPPKGSGDPVEDCERQRGWRTSRRRGLRNTTGPMHLQVHRDCGFMHRACTALLQMGPGVEGGSGHKPIPQPSSYLWSITTQKEKLVFSNFVSLRVRITLNLGPCAQHRCQHKMNSRASLEILCLRMLCWGLFSPYILCFRLCVFMRFLCVWTYVSLSLHVLTLFLLLACFALVQLVCFCF